MGNKFSLTSSIVVNMKMLSYAATLTLVLFLAVNGLFAQSSDAAAPATETPAAEEPAKSNWDLRGVVDAYYLVNSKGATFPTSFTSKSNNFMLGMANLILSKESGKVGFMADVAFGPRAEAANGYANATGAISSLALVKQLYVTYAPTDALKFTFGNFGTFYGYEVIDANVNMNYSTSYMFSFGPFFHTGLKANLKLSEKFGAMLGVFNDTDTKIDVVKGKHVGAQLSYASGNLSLYANYLTGRFAEKTETTPETFNNQFDITGTLQVTEKFGLGLNVATRLLTDKGASTRSWVGGAIYAKYAFSDLFTLALRSEMINDKDGIILGQTENKISETTLSAHFNVGPLRIIPEVRFDATSKKGSYVASNGDLLKGTSGVLLAAVYSF